MLVAESTTLIVRHIGGDAAKMLGIDADVDRPLAEFVGQANAEMAERITKTATKRAFIGTIEKADRTSINITSHLTGGYLILELEPKVGPEKSSAELLGALEAASAAFDQASTLKALCDAAAIEFRKLTGYDRVMVYRFLDDAAGEVLAEDRPPRPALVHEPSFSGIRHSATGPRALHPQSSAGNSGCQLCRCGFAAGVEGERAARHERQHFAQRLSHSSAVPSEHGRCGFGLRSPS